MAPTVVVKMEVEEMKSGKEVSKKVATEEVEEQKYMTDSLSVPRSAAVSNNDELNESLYLSAMDSSIKDKVHDYSESNMLSGEFKDHLPESGGVNQPP